MTCRFCGTPLPVGALFCVECGRSVAEGTAAPAPARRPRTPRPAASVASGAHCLQCGSGIDPADIFCGECGFVLRAPGGDVPREPPGEPNAGAVRGPNATDAAAASDTSDAAATSDTSAAVDDVESTRVMASRSRGERYVLQFSTGESIVVAGTGLIGRNPSAEPGEYVDELVAIVDVGKSVSKTHVEFGHEGGLFWVSDRYSTNGTVVRQPDADAVRCEPGKRYMIARGTRVEIGDQFFVVS